MGRRARFTRFIPLLMALGLLACGAEPAASQGSGEAGSSRRAPRRVVMRLVELSQIPDMERNLYRHCLFTAKAVVERDAGSEASTPGGEQYEILIAMWAFRDRVASPEAGLNVGDRIVATIIPFELAPEEIRPIQQSDTLDDFELPLYWADQIEPQSDAGEASADSDAPAVDLDRHSISSAAAAESQTRSSSRAPRAPHAFDAGARNARAAAIEADKRWIDDALARHGGDWERWFEQLRPMRREITERLDREGSAINEGALTFRDRYYIAQQPDAEGRWPNDAIETITELDRQLRARGIDLIVLPIPAKEEINAKAFTSHAPEDGIINPHRLRFYRSLLERDVEIINLAPALIEALGRFDYVFYDGPDPHPAQGAIQVAAQAIGRRLQRYPIVRRARESGGEWERRDVRLRFEREFLDESAPDHEYPGSQILKDGVPIAQYTEASPVIVMGDSFIGFKIASGVEGVDIPAHIAYETRIVPTRLESWEGASQIMRRMARRGPDFLKGRRVCIFALSESYMLAGDFNATTKWESIDLP